MCADVVRAYKGLLKEKEALEASLKALSIQQLEDEAKEDEGNDDDNKGGVNEPGQEETGESGEKTPALVSFTSYFLELFYCHYGKLYASCVTT